MRSIGLHATSCAICGTEGNAEELYPANFTGHDFTPEIFSARRMPDRIHYRMVTCQACGLVRSDPVADSATLGALYQQSTFEYGAEVSNLRRTYGHYLDRVSSFVSQKGALLEVGCGNGFFLEEARVRGYADVRGVEPSSEAIAKAVPGIRERLICDVMRPGLFAAESFDVVCFFQVFDHLPDPAGTLAEVRRVLKPGGVVLILNHNTQAFTNRLLGERSPIVDLEHTYLYSPVTLAKLVQGHNLTFCASGGVWNWYSLRYLARLLPLPASIKRPLVNGLSRGWLGRWSWPVPLGNLYLIAQKPV